MTTALPINITGYSPYQAPNIKVMVLGPRAGKTRWLRSISPYSTPFLPGDNLSTLGAEVTPVEIQLRGRKVRLQMWEIGSEIQGLGAKYCLGAHFGIVFKNSSLDHEQFESWITDLPKMYVNNYDNMDRPEILHSLTAMLLEHTI
jgi:hypothetical protein